MRKKHTPSDRLPPRSSYFGIYILNFIGSVQPFPRLNNIATAGQISSVCLYMLKALNRFPTLIQSLLNESSFQRTSWVYQINALVIDTFWWYYSFSRFCRREFGQIYQITFLISVWQTLRKKRVHWRWKYVLYKLMAAKTLNAAKLSCRTDKLPPRQSSLVDLTHCLRHRFSAGIHTQILTSNPGGTSNNMRKRARRIDWKVIIRQERKKPFTTGVFDCFIQGTLVASLLKARAKMQNIFSTKKWANHSGKY